MGAVKLTEGEQTVSEGKRFLRRAVVPDREQWKSPRGLQLSPPGNRISRDHTEEQRAT